MRRVLALTYRDEVFVRDVYNALATRGYDITVAPLFDAIDVSAQVCHFALRKPRCVKPFLRESGIAKEQVFITRDVSAAVRLAISRNRPDVVIAHGLYVVATPALLSVAKLRRIPFIAQTFLRPLPYELLRSAAIHRLRQTYLRIADGILAAGDTGILTHYRIDPAKVFRFHPSIDFADTSLLTDRRLPNTSALTIGYVGQLFRLKGLMDLIAAFDRVAREIPNAKLLLIGGTPAEGSQVSCEAEIRRAVASPDYCGQVEITGWLPRSDVKRRLSECDIFAFPSHGDTYPKAVMEAMSLGIPVVLSDACGCVGNLAVHGESALVFKAHDIDSLYASLSLLAQNSELRDELGERAAKKVALATVTNAADQYARCIDATIHHG